MMVKSAPEIASVEPPLSVYLDRMLKHGKRWPVDLCSLRVEAVLLVASGG